MTVMPMNAGDPDPTPSTLPSRPRPRMTGRFWAALALQVAIVAIVPAQSAYTYFTGTPVVLQTLPVDPYDLLRGYSQTLNYTISDWQTLRSLPGGDRLPSDPYAPAPLGTEGTPNTTFYVILEPPSQSTETISEAKSGAKSEAKSGAKSGAKSAGTTPPLPWIPVAVTLEPPTRLTTDELRKNSLRGNDLMTIARTNILTGDRIALRGNYDQGQPRYGLERYYFPEERRTEINDRIRQAQQRPRPTPNPPDPAQANAPLPSAPLPNAVPFVVEVRVDRTGQAVPDRLWIEGEPFRF